MFLSGRSRMKTLDSSRGENFHCLVELDVWLWTMDTFDLLCRDVSDCCELTVSG